MLYDPKWEKIETKADPYSVPSLVAWLETKPADQRYQAGRLRHCLLGQFVEAMGAVSDGEIVERSFDMGLIQPFRRIAFGGMPSPAEWTFGAALKRARAA